MDPRERLPKKEYSRDTEVEVKPPKRGGAEAEPLPIVQALIVADTVVNPIVRILSDPSNPPAIDASVKFGQVRGALGDAQGDGVLIVWTTPENTFASLAQLSRCEVMEAKGLLEEVDEFSQLVARTAERWRHVLVLSWALPPYRRWIAGMTMRPGGLAHSVMRMNLRLCEGLDGTKNVTVLDTQSWYAALGQPAFDPKLRALAKVNYSRDFFLKAAAEMKAVLRGILGYARKLVICDLDDTLWGGIVGDDGMENLRLGGHDGVGESFAEFQRELLALKNRGLLLAICSKNDPGLAMEAVERHPEMVLRAGDFAAIRISWRDKAQNIGSILDELNLLPSSAVFLDDNPVERDRVRYVFPEILVPELPADVAAYPSFLASLDCFETARITAEDQRRTLLYKEEAQRKEAASSADSLDEWLSSLGVVLTVKRLDRASLPRAAQLLNKTNQFNMATRRMEQQELWRWCQGQDRLALAFWVADKFGESGLTGLATADLREGRIIDFVMSCRVMGKGIEEAILAVVCDHLRNTAVSASYRKTERNGPFYQFISTKYADESKGVIDREKALCPIHVKVVQEE